MSKKIGLFWLKEDFRIKKNLALSEASKKHDNVVVFFLYKKNKFDNQEAQKWWIGKSLEEFKKELGKYNITLEVIQTNSYKSFFEKLLRKKNFSIYWNRTYEPSYLNFDNYLSKSFIDKKIEFKIFKGNILNEYQEVQKADGTPFKVFTPFWKNSEKYYIEKIPSKEKKITKCKNKNSFFTNTIDISEIYPKKKWFNKFEKYWHPNEENALKELKFFISSKIENYSEARNFHNTEGTSKLSPYIKHGQIHVETIWEECIKTGKSNINKFLTEIGWREFNHSLINFFPHMLKKNYSKKFDGFPWEKNLKFLKAWKKGLTGYPIVDAGMREMLSTGWMHNRVRMDCWIIFGETSSYKLDRGRKVF